MTYYLFEAGRSALTVAGCLRNHRVSGAGMRRLVRWRATRHMGRLEGDATSPVRRPSGIPLWAKLALMALFGGIVGLSMFTVTYAEATSYLSDNPDSCRNCHVMNDVHDAWARGPHHAVATCNDCHIPRDFPAKYVVKAMNGWNHSLAFTLQDFPEPIRITPFNKTVALGNCLACHGDFVSLVNHQGQAELEDCTRCHASIGHDEIGVGKP